MYSSIHACCACFRVGGERRTKELFTELVRREELLFSMVSGIRLDLDKVKDQMRAIDETLTRILQVEEESLTPKSEENGR